MKRFLATGWCLSVIGLALAVGAQADAPKKASTADHTKFEELQVAFATGPDVTKACLGCHTEAAAQIHDSIHWTWEYDHPETGQKLGKKYVLNNFCGTLVSNFPRCTSCHAGYGWKDGSFDFSAKENVDCLVCHDTTGTYVKFPTGAGHPPYEDTPFMGKVIKAPDLTNVAQHVGKTSRATCGACHFTGGGGDAVKHGDMDTSLAKPAKSLDVHMDVDGLNYSCATCHTFINHQQAGSRYLMSAKDTVGVAVPGVKETRASCESCHGLEPHPGTVNNKLNDHVDKVACQTCHIPAFARGGKATKVWWDWSSAGEKGPDGKPLVKKDEQGHVVYDGMKGDFRFAEDVVPEYFWFDGSVRFTMVGDPIDTAGVVQLNSLKGGYADPNARIWPFKVMRGKQPYDTGNDILLAGHLFGKDEAAFWKNFDWGKALAFGMAEAKAAGVTDADFSGDYGFIETEMFWPITHMVAPADEALGCADCHAKDGRLANLTGFYMPGRDSNPWIERIGWILVAATLLGVLLHGLVRLFFGKKRA